jgi:hypothetical protein
MENEIMKEQGVNPKAVVINKIIIRPVDRSPKDIQRWRTAHKYAESIVYANRVLLYDLYDDVVLDGHLTGVWQKRVDAVLNKNLHFEVNGKRIDEMNKVIESEVFRDIITLLMEKKMWGLSGFEFIPGPKLEFEPIPRKHIKPDLRIISYEQSGQEGISYDDVDNLWIVGKRRDLGLLLKLAPYALYKRGNMADWAQYIEIFGQPIRVVRYDAHDEQTKIELQQVLDESGSSLAMMIPKQADFDLKDGKISNGDGQLQEKFKKSCDDEMSVIVLTNTETTTSSKSSGYAQSKEHGKQQLEVTKSDLKDIQNLLNSDQFLRILKSYNLPVEGGLFVYEKEIDVEALVNRVEIDMQVSGKVPIEDDYWYDTYGIPKPANYAELRKKMDDENAANGNSNDPEKNPEKNNAPAKKKKVNKLLAELKSFFD